jgi:Tfp pilus assembly protein PilN
LIEINLLTSGAEKRRNAPARSRSLSMPKLSLGSEPTIPVLAALAVLVLLGSGFSWWRLGAQHANLTSTIEREARDSVAFASTIELVQMLRSREDTIRQRIGVIRSVDEGRYVWAHLLDEISRAVPAYTWLNALSSQQDDASSPTVTLQGNAGSTQALTRFMKNLEASPFIRNVTLVTSEQASEAGRSFQKFTLEARYEHPDQAILEMVPVIITD